MFDRFRHKQPSLKQASFRLTEEGRAKVQSTFGSGGAGPMILVALETDGSSMDLDDLARATGIPRGRLEHILPGLLRRGYINAGGQGVGSELDG